MFSYFVTDSIRIYLLSCAPICIYSPLYTDRAFVFDYTYVESSRPLSFIYYNKFITRRLSSVCSIEISVIFSIIIIIIIIIMFVLLRQGNVQ